ncbi:TIGR03862 family flavoprotein [Rhodobacteraceae bacterium CCMM004]|nr:TIGR03862 family flavoprotein [Rhodobacteraceae bacterium CCMM004]
MTGDDGAPHRRGKALVIGAGPAGLMAADALLAAGHAVTLAEAKPSAGRKLLMAGKSGLNLTKAEPPEAFCSAYGPEAPQLRPMLAAFGPDAVQAWAEGLGQPVFTGSSGRVFPTAMKASPLLRAWLARLGAAGLDLRTRWRWEGGLDGGIRFATPEGPRTLHPDATVLALGGASWPRLGSDGAWVPWLRSAGVAVTPLAPSNAGLSIAWSAHMAPHYGKPVKPVGLSAGDISGRGECAISAPGLEGSGIYRLSRAVRAGAPVSMDLLPDLDVAAAARRLAAGPPKATTAALLRRMLRLDPTRAALAQEFGRPLPRAPMALAARLKALPVPHRGLRPLDEAISTAGGVAWPALDDDLMLRARPGIYAAGEMLDWDAPTGGYLLTACLATGLWAGRAAARRLSHG